MTEAERAKQHLEAVVSRRPDALDGGAAPPASPPSPFPGGPTATPRRLERRWRRLREQVGPEIAERVRRAWDFGGEDPETFGRNAEGLVGLCRVPVGVAGPLRVTGTHADGDYLVPLATTEAALVASHDRGMRAIGQSGGCRAALLGEGVTRAPGLAFADMAEAGRFLAWLLPRCAGLKAAADATTRHGRLDDVRVHVEANYVFLLLRFTTADAAGQNMTTIAAQAALDWAVAGSPVRPRSAYVEANLSGDKKASLISMLGVRGRKVSAEALVPAAVVRRRLGATPAAMRAYWDVAAAGAGVSGSLGVQGQYANGLAALFVATGQDAACVAESAVGRTRMEVTAEGDLYACVTLPNLIVGTVGGGTGLPSAAAGLGLMGLRGAGKANALAEVAAGVVLAGELSIVAALAAGEFTRAHRRLARGREGGR